MKFNQVREFESNVTLSFFSQNLHAKMMMEDNRNWSGKPEKVRPAIHLLWNAVKRLGNMKKWKVCRVWLALFTEHLFCISFYTWFHSRKRFFDEMSKVSNRILCKSPLIRSLESKFHENGEKWAKECFTFHFLFLWNTFLQKKKKSGNIEYHFCHYRGTIYCFSHFVNNVLWSIFFKTILIDTFYYR